MEYLNKTHTRWSSSISWIKYCTCLKGWTEWLDYINPWIIKGLQKYCWDEKEQYRLAERREREVLAGGWLMEIWLNRSTQKMGKGSPKARLGWQGHFLSFLTAPSSFATGFCPQKIPCTQLWWPSSQSSTSFPFCSKTNCLTNWIQTPEKHIVSSPYMWLCDNFHISCSIWRF